jgi:hypothetical protein
MEIGKLEKILDKVLFGFENGEDIVSLKNHKYHISRNTTPPKGLVEKLQIGMQSNLGISNIVAKKLRDGIVEGVKQYLEKEKEVEENIKKVEKENKEIEKESKKEDAIIADIAEQLEAPKKKKK